MGELEVQRIWLGIVDQGGVKGDHIHHLELVCSSSHHSSLLGNDEEVIEEKNNPLLLLGVGQLNEGLVAE